MPSTPKDPQLEQNGRSLLAALLMQQPDIDDIKFLVRRSDLTLEDKNGNTALMTISGWGNLELMKLMLDNGAKPNQKGRSGNTTMHLVINGGNEKAIDLMLAYGGDVSIPNGAGSTPLDWAKGKKFSPELMKRLEQRFAEQDPASVKLRQISEYIDQQGLRTARPIVAPQTASFKQPKHP